MQSLAYRYVLKHGLLFLLTWAVFLSGCSRWRTLQQPFNLEQPSELAVTLTDRSVVWMEDSYVRADTLFGTVVAPTLAKAHGDIGIPLNQVLVVQAKKPPDLRTIVAGTVALAGVAVIAALVVAVSDLNLSWGAP